MKRLERLDEAAAPDGTVLTLCRRDGDYFIRAAGEMLMSTRRHHSEDRLAEVVCEPLRHVPAARVLIGGLGFGFTLRAAMSSLGDDAGILVVELVEAVIRWNRDRGYDLACTALQDARVTLLHDDVARVLAANRGAFDGIMLDIDNGAEALTTAGNARLYRSAGIRTAVAALRPGGRVAYWSSTIDERFADALRGAGLDVEAQSVRAHSTGGARYMLYVGRRTA
ncbi:spermidine synthase [soil metagenome]